MRAWSLTKIGHCYSIEGSSVVAYKYFGLSKYLFKPHRVSLLNASVTDEGGRLLTGDIEVSGSGLAKMICYGVLRSKRFYQALETASAQTIELQLSNADGGSNASVIQDGDQPPREWKIDHPDKDFIIPSCRNFKAPQFDRTITARGKGKEVLNQQAKSLSNYRRIGVFDEVVMPLPKSLLWYTIHQTVYAHLLLPQFGGCQKDILLPLPEKFGPGHIYSITTDMTEPSDISKASIHCVLSSNNSDEITFFIDNTRGNSYPDDPDWRLKVSLRAASPTSCQVRVELSWFERRDFLLRLFEPKENIRLVKNDGSSRHFSVFQEFFGNLAFVSLCIDKFGFVPGEHDRLYESSIQNIPSHLECYLSYNDFTPDLGTPMPGSSIERAACIGTLDFLGTSHGKSSSDVTVGCSFPNVEGHYFSHFFVKHGDTIPAIDGLGVGRDRVALTSEYPWKLARLDPEQPNFLESTIVVGLSERDYRLVPPYVSKGQRLGVSRKGEEILSPVSGFAKFNYADRHFGSIIIRKAEIDPSDVQLSS